MKVLLLLSCSKYSNTAITINFKHYISTIKFKYYNITITFKHYNTTINLQYDNLSITPCTGNTHTKIIKSSRINTDRSN